MNLSLDLMQLGSGIIALVLTLFVFSYLLGDNFLFRIATYIFVGTSAGYVASVVVFQVIIPDLVNPLISGNAQSGSFYLLFIPLILGVLLLMKISPRLSNLGRLPMAYLAGTGAAIAIGGAVTGTIFPQINASLSPFALRSMTAGGLLTGTIVLVGTVGTLIYFHFSARQKEDGSAQRNRIIEFLALLGRIFIAITFGMLFAGVYSAALSALIERLNSFLTFFGSL
jgi:hypothetical protein